MRVSLYKTGIAAAVCGLIGASAALAASPAMDLGAVKDSTISGHGRRHSQAEDSVLLTPSNPNEREPSVSRCPKTPSRSPLTRWAARRGTRTR